MSTHEPRCPALHDDLPYSRCALDERHAGTHRNFAGFEWGGAPDLMDGGVTCAAIEAEALTNEARNEQARIDHIHEQDRIIRRRNDQLAEVCAQRDECAARAAQAERALADVHERDETVARLEARLIEAEQELDDARHDVNAYSSALSRVRAALGLADDASTDDMVERAECHDCIRDAAVTDAKVDRAWHVSNTLREDRWPSREEVRQILTAAATPEPQRPEGAEKWESALNDFWNNGGDADDLPDWIARHGGQFGILEQR